MKVTLDDFIKRLDKAAALIPQINEDNVQIAAFDAIATIDERITSSGKNAKGQDFAPYDPQYQKRKEKAGRYKGHVDFRMTDRMMNSVKILDKRNAAGKIVMTVGTTGLGGADKNTKKKNASRYASNREKMEYNVERRGAILELSKSEAATLIKEKTQRDIKKIETILFK